MTSQLLVNVYLNEFDWWIKQKLSIKYYFRYCDDFIIVLQKRQDVEILIPLIREKLKEYALELHPQKLSVRKVRQGIDFLGYVILPHCIVLRTKTKARIYKKLQNIDKAQIDSYLGVATYAKGRDLIKELLQHKSFRE